MRTKEGCFTVVLLLVVGYPILRYKPVLVLVAPIIEDDLRGFLDDATDAYGNYAVRKVVVETLIVPS